MSEPRLEQTVKGLALVNGCCNKPHAYERGGKLRFNSRHERDPHPLELTPAKLRELADELERKGGATWRV